MSDSINTFDYIGCFDSDQNMMEFEHNNDQEYNLYNNLNSSCCYYTE